MYLLILLLMSSLLMSLLRTSSAMFCMIVFTPPVWSLTSQKSAQEDVANLEIEKKKDNVVDSEDSAKDAMKMKLSPEPVRSSAKLAGKQSFVHQIQKQIIFKPKKQDEVILMHSYSWIFFDKDIDMEEEVEDTTTANPPNQEMLVKQVNIPVLRRSSRLAEQLTGPRKGAKRVMEEKEEVRMEKAMRKPWNYGTGGGRKPL